MALATVIALAGIVMLLAMRDRPDDSSQAINARWWLRLIAFWLLGTGIFMTLVLVVLRVLRFVM
jgi:hypothetical protein